MTPRRAIIYLSSWILVEGVPRFTSGRNWISNDTFHISCPTWVKFGVRFLHAMALHPYQFRESRWVKALLYLWDEKGKWISISRSKLFWGMYHRTEWQFESAECLSIFCILRHGTHPLQLCWIFSPSLLCQYLVDILKKSGFCMKVWSIPFNRNRD